ncbi:MAG: hypothetical protein ACMUEL_09165 [Flavobacteriales bacterium Tduv]
MIYRYFNLLILCNVFGIRKSSGVVKTGVIVDASIAVSLFAPNEDSTYVV